MGALFMNIKPAFRHSAASSSASGLWRQISQDNPSAVRSTKHSRPCTTRNCCLAISSPSDRHRHPPFPRRRDHPSPVPNLPHRPAPPARFSHPPPPRSRPPIRQRQRALIARTDRPPHPPLPNTRTPLQPHSPVSVLSAHAHGRRPARRDAWHELDSRF
jgi:hypothetical protein